MLPRMGFLSKKIAADPGGRVGFQIERFVLRRPTPKIKLDDAFEARLAGCRLSLENLRQAETGQGESAGAEKFPPADAVAQSRTRTA